MSNFDPDNKNKKSKPTSSPSLQKLKWKSIRTDLTVALADWAEDANSAHKKTPEEVQLDKVKNMIVNIKDKLNQF
jgi:hypothetical protein